MGGWTCWRSAGQTISRLGAFSALGLKGVTATCLNTKTNTVQIKRMLKTRICEFCASEKDDDVRPRLNFKLT